MSAFQSIHLGESITPTPKTRKQGGLLKIKIQDRYLPPIRARSYKQKLLARRKHRLLCSFFPFNARSTATCAKKCISDPGKTLVRPLIVQPEVACERGKK